MIPGRGTKVLHAAWCGPKPIKTKKGRGRIWWFSVFESVKSKRLKWCLRLSLSASLSFSFPHLLLLLLSLPTPLTDSHGSVFCVDSVLGPVFPTWWERWSLPPPASPGAAYDSGTRGSLSPSTRGSVLGAVEAGAVSSCGDHIDCGPRGWRADQV